MKIFTIIGGVNGVGKSSLTGVLKALRNDMGIIIGCENAETLVHCCLEKGVDFTQETTLSGKKTLKTVIAARERDYYIRLYYVAVSSAEESVRLIENRVSKGGHDIPEEDVKRRFSKRFDDLIAILPYCREVHFYDNENGFEEVGEYRNGTLTVTAEAPPKWLCGIKENIKNQKYKGENYDRIFSE
ncbi:MAG: zeta toxin family protein [Oscillospiraceae bacterium]|nr:zeta toxin family protein [Oscillospiraceae bacterium]